MEFVMVVVKFHLFSRKHMKLAIITLLVLAGTLMTMATLVLEKVIAFDQVLTFKIILYVLLILGITISCSVAPIAFEFCVEICYPVSEGILGKTFQNSLILISGWLRLKWKSFI